MSIPTRILVRTDVDWERMGAGEFENLAIAPSDVHPVAVAAAQLKARQAASISSPSEPKRRRSARKAFARSPRLAS